MGEPLGEFDTEYEGPEFRFNVKDWLESNDTDRCFVSILNLSRIALDITDIRLEFKGIR